MNKFFPNSLSPFASIVHHIQQVIYTSSRVLYSQFFKGLQNYLDGLKLTSREEVKHEFFPYFALKHKEFYKQGIYKPADKLNGLLGNSGGYVNDSIYLLP